MKLSCRLTCISYSLAPILFLGLISACAATAQVPPSYQDLYDQLSGDLNDFNTTLDSLYNGSPYPVLYTGELTNANSNNGPQMLSSTFMTSITNQLQMLQAMGNQAVAVEVSFPMLYQPFFDFIGQSAQNQQFIAVYSQVAAAVRAQGMKLIVECQTMMPNGLGSTSWGPQLTSFYPTLSWTQYQTARAQAAQLVAQTMQPDYMVLLEEPDTEASQTGQTNVNTVSGASSLVDMMHYAVLQAAVPGLRIGAGVGTWLPNYQDFINAFTHQQCDTLPCLAIPLYFIDMHLYSINEMGAPTNYNFWQNAIDIINIATAADRSVSMSQSWLRKVRNTEWGTTNGDILESRDVFSFWMPLDTLFLQTAQKLANYGQMLFMAPFNTQNMSAYLTYTDQLGGDSPSDLFSQEFSQAATNAQLANFSNTGLYYYGLIVSPPDTTPPAPPPGLSARATSSSAVNVTWSPSTDNIAVAGYSIWRDGVQLGTTVNTYFQDSGLSTDTTYNYEVIAFDLAWNLSQPSVATVTTLPF